MTGNVIETSAYTSGYLHSYASYFYDPYGLTYSNYHEYGQPGALPLTLVYVYTGRSSSFVGNGFYVSRTDQTPSCQAFYLSSTNNVTAIGNLVYDVAASTVTSNMCTVAYMTGYVRSPVLLGNEVYWRDTGSGSWTSNRTTSEIYSGLSVAPGGIAHGDSLWVSGDFEQSGDVYQTGQASTVVSVGEFTKADDVAYINLGDTTFLGQVTIRAFPFFQSNNAMGYLEYECSFYHATGVATLTPSDSICRTVKATGNIARWYFFGPAELNGTEVRIPMYHNYITTDEYQTLSVEVIARSSVANHAKNLIAAVTVTAPTPAAHGLSRSYEEAEIGFKIWGREYGDDVTLADATLYLYADQGDDPADKWSIVSQASTNNLSFQNNGTESVRIDSTGGIMATNYVSVLGVEGASASLYMASDEGDDATDSWIIRVEESGNNMTWYNNASPVASLTPTGGFSATSVTDSGLTATRVPFAGTGGLLSDDADMTFATDTLTITKIATTQTTITGPTAGTLTNKVYEAVSSALSGATGSIAVNVASGEQIIGTACRVETAITSGDGGTTFSAAFATGSTAALSSGTLFAKDTKILSYTTDVTTDTTTITLTCDGGKTFNAGVVRCTVWTRALAIANTP